MAAHGETKIERVGDGQTGAAERTPGLSIHTGVAVEYVPGALQAQPILRIIDRKRTLQGRTTAGNGAGFKKAAAEDWRSQHTDAGAVGIQGYARHQAGLGPNVRIGQRFQAHRHVKIVGENLVKEMELIGRSANVGTARPDVHAPGRRHRGSGQRRAANVCGCKIGKVQVVR